MYSQYTCGRCGKPVSKTAGRCPYCSANLAGIKCNNCGYYRSNPAAFLNDRCPACGSRINTEKKSTESLRLVLSLLGPVIGIVMVFGSLRQAEPNYGLAVGGAAVFVLGIGWILNSRWAKIITGFLFVPVGLVGALLIVWNFIKNALSGIGIIDNIPLPGNGLTIPGWPSLLLFLAFSYLLGSGMDLIKGKKP